MIYVDDIKDYTNNGARFCHLIANSEKELNAIANALGLGQHRRFGKTLPHYRLNEKERERAIRYGAIALDLSYDRRSYVEAVYVIEKAVNSGSFTKAELSEIEYALEDIEQGNVNAIENYDAAVSALSKVRSIVE